MELPMSFNWLVARTGISRNENSSGADQRNLHLPDPGELNKRVLIRQRVDMPRITLAWSLNTRLRSGHGRRCPDQCHHLAGNRADRGRHHPYITIRYRRGITADYEVVCGAVCTG